MVSKKIIEKKVKLKTQAENLKVFEFDVNGPSGESLVVQSNFRLA